MTDGIERKVFYVIEQKIFEIEDEKERFGMYSPILEAQLDVLHDIMSELRKYLNS
jgi:hypothetical protein